jgi:hypothetical protein
MHPLLTPFALAGTYQVLGLSGIETDSADSGTEANLLRRTLESEVADQDVVRFRNMLRQHSALLVRLFLLLERGNHWRTPLFLRLPNRALQNSINLTKIEFPGSEQT